MVFEFIIPNPITKKDISSVPLFINKEKNESSEEDEAFSDSFETESEEENDLEEEEKESEEESDSLNGIRIERPNK